MVSWLVIGVGDITRKRVLPAIASEPHSRLTGIVTRDPRKAEPYNVPAWTDLNTALRECDCNAVYVASPVVLHEPQTLASLYAAKDVLCEKPMAMNHTQAKTMVEEAKRTSQILGVAYYRRMYPAVDRLRKLLDEGRIGRPVFGFATAYSWSLQQPTEEGGWRFDPAMAGGGPFYDIASHRIDLMNFLFGEPVRTCGQIATTVHDIAVEDNATVLIEHASGLRSVTDVRWHSHVTRDEFLVRGTDGEIDLSPLNSGYVKINGREPEFHPPHANLHYPCIENFVTAVEFRDENLLRASGATSLATDRVTEQVMSANAR